MLMISVIIPVYNGEKTIGACLSALHEQTLKPDEIIVVDDGSSDGTKETIKKSRATILLEQNHKGPASARNAGAKRAKGSILLFTDADCIPDKDWVNEMADSFKNKDITGVQGRYKTMQKNSMARFVQLEIEDRYDRMRKRKHIDFIGSYAAGYRKDVFLEFGGFDESFSMASGEDPDISFKLAAAGHKMVFNENAVVYHNHVSSLGAYMKQKFWRAYWRVHLYKKHPDKIAGESYTPQTLKIQIFLLIAVFSSLAMTLLYSQLLIISVISTILLLASTLPLTFKNMKKSFVAGLITPFISIMRTIVFALGLACGVLKL